MALMTLDSKKLKENYQYLSRLFDKNGIQWSVVTKVLCGNKDYLDVVLNLGISQVCDSRITNLKAIKSLRPGIETIYIKPPARRSVKKVVEYADISFNTSFETIKLLSNAAVAQNKTHRIIIMVELGELREGVLRDDLVDFYSSVFKLPNIEVIGLGTNLTCMYGILPNHDKLLQLKLYKQLIEATFNKRIPLLSGGASVTIPMIDDDTLPAGINHFRVGETLFLGTDVYNNAPYPNLHHDVFKLYAEIIELYEKPNIPSGEFGYNLHGEKLSFSGKEKGSSYRAIIDVGVLDAQPEHITPADKDLTIAGASSDMIVVDVGGNGKNYKVGDLLEFRMDYMGILRLMNSVYIDKRVVEEQSASVKIHPFSKITNLN